MTNNKLKRFGKGIGITLGFVLLLVGVLILVFSFFAGYASGFTTSYGVTAAILTVPFVYVVVDEYRNWLRNQY